MERGNAGGAVMKGSLVHLAHEQPKQAEDNEAVIRRFYGELWNRWRLELVDELVSPTLRFR
jgi:hypothetical protein